MEKKNYTKPINFKLTLKTSKI